MVGFDAFGFTKKCDPKSSIGRLQRVFRGRSEGATFRMLAVVASFGRWPRPAVLLFVAYLSHLAEEWFGGFPAWTRAVLGNGVSAERFALVNGIGLLLFATLTLVALRSPSMVWFYTSFAALTGINGVLHALATLAFGRYSPGTITGLLLYLPLSVIVLGATSSRLSGPVFAISVLGGMLFHGFVTFMALQ